MITKDEVFFFLMCLLIIIPPFNAGLNSYLSVSCDRERKVLNDTYGIITNGNKEYPMDSHCEWLIKANDPNLFITLSFTKMDTECSYDHVFIYDGDSYASPLLGSFSGNTTPPSVTSSHGLMLILLYSDTNYVRSGFEAIYSVTNCPLNCSLQGQCINYKCFCEPLWSGKACEISLCPADCGTTDGRGECQNKSSDSKCRCRPGYSGMDCSLPDSNKNGGNSWHMLASDGFEVIPRAGHTGTYIPQTDSFYIFGGYTFRKVLGDLVAFSFEANQWITFGNKVSPSARHGHAAVNYKGHIIVFGGELENKRLSNEIWLFNTSSQEWSLLSPKSDFLPPPMTKHSLVLVEEEWLYVIGGSLSDGTFSSSVYKVNVAGSIEWEKVVTYGNKQSIHRVVGHSAVYYQQMKTIFVFGGVIAEYSHVSKLSNHIHAYHTEKRFWTKIKYGREKFIPLERAFHTAAIIGDYMVVYGGYTHKHIEEEICYDNEFHLYYLRCNKWIDFSNLRKDFIGSANPISQGVFSHAMSVRLNHTLLIHGGYNGIMRASLLAYVLPSVIISDQHVPEPCSRHKQQETCESNVACGWCVDENICLEQKNGKTCKEFSSKTCSGFCSALSNCYSCLIWSQSFSENAISDDHNQVQTEPCAWCAQTLECYSVNDPPHTCSANSSSANKRSTYGLGSTNWWGPHGTGILAMEDCYAKDRHPGIVSIKYKHPVNLSQPDDVTFLRLATEELFFRSEVQTNESTGFEENIVKFLGYIHPLGAKPLSERMSQLQLFSCSASSSAVFKLSNDSTMQNLEIVANHTPKPSFYCSNAQRPKGALLFANTSTGYKYMFDFTVTIPAAVNETSIVQLTWNAFSVTAEIIGYKHLEPYINGSCSEFKSCLACMTDAACGWCENSGRCHPKFNHKENCEENGLSFLVTHPNDCTVCSDYIYCELCTQFSNCEWLVETAICVRHGRFPNVVKDPNYCPVACHMRSSCSSCLGDPGMCAWCEETQTCFLFSTYTSAYSYGRCRDWVDENRSEIGSDPVNLCRNCSRHKQCSSCIKDLACGWCSYSKLSPNGTCADGDFSGVSAGTCPIPISNGDEIISPSDFNWSYSSCPDIEECLLGLHECNINATCKNTPSSYTCECNVGFEGDGKICVRACAVKCIHGYCSDAPDYECVCDLGWTGKDCNTSCGCHNHSSCTNGVGLCDECLDWTEGKFCEICKTGSYGDATGPNGCQKCNCNGHGDYEKGYCNATTGVCYCLNKTIGPNCSKCQPGYYGDPRNNGECFEECHPRKVITNVTNGKLGSPMKSSSSRDCLWLLTVHSVLDMQSLLGPMQSTGTYIQLIIHKDINIPCPHNHVYIYDGLPNFVASGHPNVLLGAFCGSNLTQPIIATAASGYLTVHFKHDSKNHGFNASYIRLENCSLTDKSPCYDENCVGKVNYTSCRTLKCPNNCSSLSNQGICDSIQGKCLCSKDFGGNDCSVKLLQHHLVWSEVYDHRRLLQDNVTFDVPTERMGHSLTSVVNVSNSVQNLWLFGGYSSAFGYHNDLHCFDTNSSQWHKIESENSPKKRHFHAAAAYREMLYVYGGLDQYTIYEDFWQFNTSAGIWSQLEEISGPKGVVSLAGSTLTAVDHVLVLIGGFSPTYGFFDKIMEFDTDDQHWHYINATGAQPIGIYGHSSVYHRTTESIYVFGGVSYDVEHVAASSSLYTFHYPTYQWFRLPPDNKVNPLKIRPLPRYFHTSIPTENYVIIIGGRNSGKLDESIQPYAYIFSCNLWIPLTDEAIEVIGQPPKTLIGASADVANGEIYIFGGFYNYLMKLRLPTDICYLFSTNRVGCIHQTGCAFCSLYENGLNQTFCYSQDRHAVSRCYNPKEASKFLPAVSCNSDWIEKRDCQQYTSCTDCVTSWPFYKHANQVCQWCSNCKAGRCVQVGFSCDEENDCNIPRKVIKEPSMCPLRVCGASDCEKCGALQTCIWTRQVNRSSGFGHTLNRKPIFNWVCVMKEIQAAPPFPIESMPPLTCPVPCMEHTDCTSCLKSQGGEGGWRQCYWSESLQNCLSPTYELLRCEDGSCGPVLRGNESSCPLPCWQHFQASLCLSQANCGWCAFSGAKVDGRGLCINGGIMGPTGGICKESQVLLLGLPLPADTAKWFLQSEGPPKWTYLTKPPENECDNGHHNCDDAHEECIDTPKGFECHCKQGYTFKGKQCTPTCKQGCVNGTCIQPDVCQCNFGYVGSNCSIMCKCNGHSNCPGPDKLDVCTECKNNTLGPQCQKCKPFFVGNPVNSGKCVSCYEYCYKHSGLCLSSDILANYTNQLLNQSFMNEILEKLEEGALEDAICLDCQNHTEGKRCDRCIPGYFKAGENLEDGCRPCECHGHGDMCNPLNGENCNCQNNTENDRQCSQKNMKNIMHITPCWQLQCSKCREYFLGAPIHGHQCYRHMFLDKEYCFDPNTQDECNRSPASLLKGHTVFFAVQPRYMNVDIRIVVDVTAGGIDFFLSAKEDAFIVDVDKVTGIHHIYVDEKYGIDLGNEYEIPPEVEATLRRKRREVVVEDIKKESSNTTDAVPVQSLHPKIGDAQGFTTYIDVKKYEEFLLVRNLENRLIVTIPQEVHDLRSTRFYMVLRGSGNFVRQSTYGSLFFRQDQTRIDLFVFFSVFFSCFFLFLAVCVVVWKVKQAFDLRRARRLHAAEMKHMASRPFGHIVTIVDDEPEDRDFLLYSPSNYRKKMKHSKAHSIDSPKIFEDKFSLRPLAVEPLSDNFGAIATILVQLPGGAQSLVRMTLASSLITSRSSHYHTGCGLRAAMRRRTSHANV